MKKLLKEYSFTTDMEYYDMIIESVINGQRTQAKEQFNAMPKDNQKYFISLMCVTPAYYGIDSTDKIMFINEL